MFTICYRSKMKRHRSVFMLMIRLMTLTSKGTWFPMGRFPSFFRPAFALVGWSVGRELLTLSAMLASWSRAVLSTTIRPELLAVWLSWGWLRSNWRNACKPTRINAMHCAKLSTCIYLRRASLPSLEVDTSSGLPCRKTAMGKLWLVTASRSLKCLRSEAIGSQWKTNSVTSFACHLHFTQRQPFEKLAKACATASPTILA